MVSCRNNWAWQAAEPGALITDNPLEEARDPSMGLQRLRMFAICDQHAHTHISEALFAVTQECPYTFSDSPAYLRQKKAGSLTEVN